MALVTLQNGKVIDVDINWYLSLSDEEYQDLNAMNVGFEVEDPFHLSSLKTSSYFEAEEEDVEDEGRDSVVDDGDDIPPMDDI
jgi:hypothetical protein